jgi:hypothetical protein
LILKRLCSSRSSSSSSRSSRHEHTSAGCNAAHSTSYGSCQRSRYIDPGNVLPGSPCQQVDHCTLCSKWSIGITSSSQAHETPKHACSPCCAAPCAVSLLLLLLLPCCLAAKFTTTPKPSSTPDFPKLTHDPPAGLVRASCALTA